MAAIMFTLLVTTIAVFPVAAAGDNPADEARLLRALSLDAPDVARISQNVALTVTEKGSGDAVKDARIWVLKREDAQYSREEIQSLGKLEEKGEATGYPLR